MKVKTRRVDIRREGINFLGFKPNLAQVPQTPPVFACGTQSEKAAKLYASTWEKSSTTGTGGKTVSEVVKEANPSAAGLGRFTSIIGTARR